MSSVLVRRHRSPLQYYHVCVTGVAIGDAYHRLLYMYAHTTIMIGVLIQHGNRRSAPQGSLVPEASIHAPMKSPRKSSSSVKSPRKSHHNPNPDTTRILIGDFFPLSAATAQMPT
jgi:hypothetical protein